MRKTAFRLMAGAALLAPIAALAQQSRPSTTSMSCAAARGLVQSRGALVLDTGGDTFDRFVRDSYFCASSQKATQAFAPTSDQRQCFIGSTCVDSMQERR